MKLVRRRRKPSPSEQARRIAQGRKMGAIGSEWKRTHNPKGS